ncbi:hypothetical protein NA56DRAFT_650351 [Hyaloscypha hepaticicola]|uniref:Peptidase S33 tripeptidyl aminopeptidase-like C-terminal domain-containing protein n=1 Tax=Hyaloscypha hepaticicola TaxID=2082293 RepID=A0A2J6PMG6_9HELO|nr:hypothetical protein NA56DRAFT_650351 [Hyaloscypha hepaticicola]
MGGNISGVTWHNLQQSPQANLLSPLPPTRRLPFFSRRSLRPRSRRWKAIPPTLPQQYELPLCDPNTGQPAEPSPETPEMEISPDASLAILCSDQAPFLGGISAFSNYLDKCENASKSASETMASICLGCVDWGIRAKWRYAGPFKTNISTPILFVGNTADNITPIEKRT